MRNFDNPLSLAHLTVLELSPPEMIRVAARCGYDFVGLRLLKVTETSPSYPLMDDPVLMRETKEAIAQEGVGVCDIEFVKITPEIDVASLEAMVASGAEIGAKNLITAPYDPDLGHLCDKLAELSQMTQRYGINTVLEFFPWTNVPDLHTALSVVQNAADEVKILVDTLHFNRSNSSLDELAQIDESRFAFMHLCDAPVLPSYTSEELLFAGRAERCPPGQGQINLGEIINRLPKDIPIALEVPMTELSQSKGAGHVALTVYDTTVEFLNNLKK